MLPPVEWMRCLHCDQIADCPAFLFRRQRNCIFKASDPSHEANTLCDTQSSARRLVVLQTVTLGRKTLENQPTAAYICNLSESRDWLLAFDVTNGWKPW